MHWFFRVALLEQNINGLLQDGGALIGPTKFL
jgi:hypothetical protein